MLLLGGVFQKQQCVNFIVLKTGSKLLRDRLDHIIALDGISLASLWEIVR